MRPTGTPSRNLCIVREISVTASRVPDRRRRCSASKNVAHRTLLAAGGCALVYFPPVADTLVTYLTQRKDGSVFLPPADVERALAQIFPRADWVLPRPYKIFFADEQQLPVYGFPVHESPALRDLDAKLDRWLAEESMWSIDRSYPKERVQTHFAAYVTSTMRLAENAMLSNLMADYHAVFWLAHSFDLARHFTAVPRRLSQIDLQIGRSQGDTLKYKIFSKWSIEMKEQMAKLAARLAPTLEGEQDRGLAFFKTLNENVLIFTEEFIGPDLRELRSFVAGYLHRDYPTFKESFERFRNIVDDIYKRDRAVRNAIELFGVANEQGVSMALLVDRRFQKFLFDHPTVEAALNREERENISSLSRRLCEFGVLHSLRKSINWMTSTPDGEVLPLDRKGATYSRSTRPIDFGRPGVVDPMVYRFGLMYDISSFSETLGNLARAGRKGELNSFRQMLLFQRRMDSIAERHRLQFEKFLGDGAFYTTRQAMRLVRAAVEIQRFYAEMKLKGFAFNRGLRIALNYGYYRLLPMKGLPESGEKVMEFYGPGIVELSRLTTGKATKEIEEIQGFLVSHGYEPGKVQNFFAPLARGVDVVDHTMHARDFYAYVNGSGHLVNEGIVASLALIQELSNEITAESQKLYRLQNSWGTYFGFVPSQEGIEYIGIRLIGNVSLKGLQNIDVAEVVSFAPGEITATPAAAGETLLAVLRQEYHERARTKDGHSAAEVKTSEHRIEGEIVISTRSDDELQSTYLLGEWDPRTDEINQIIEVEWEDLQQSAGFSGPVTIDSLESQKDSLRRFYDRRKKLRVDLAGELPTIRRDHAARTFVLGEKVEKL